MCGALSVMYHVTHVRMTSSGDLVFLYYAMLAAGFEHQAGPTLLANM